MKGLKIVNKILLFIIAFISLGVAGLNIFKIVEEVLPMLTDTIVIQTLAIDVGILAVSIWQIVIGIILIVHAAKNKFSRSLTKITSLVSTISFISLISNLVPVVLHIYVDITSGTEITVQLIQIIYIICGFLFFTIQKYTNKAYKKKSFIQTFIFAAIGVAGAIAYYMFSADALVFEGLGIIQLISKIVTLSAIGLPFIYLITLFILNRLDPCSFIHREIDGRDYQIRKTYKDGSQKVKVFSVYHSRGWIVTLVFGLIGAVALLAFGGIYSVTTFIAIDFSVINFENPINLVALLDVITGLYPFLLIPPGVLFIYGLIRRDATYYSHSFMYGAFTTYFLIGLLNFYLNDMLSGHFELMAIISLSVYVLSSIVLGIGKKQTNEVFKNVYLDKETYFQEGKRLIQPTILYAVSVLLISGWYFYITLTKGQMDFLVFIYWGAVLFFMLFNFLYIRNPLEESFKIRRKESGEIIYK